jgi:effector-binding domain-containing protein
MKKTALVLGFLLFCTAAGPARLLSAPAAQAAPVKIEKIEPFAYFCLKQKGSFSNIQEVIQRLMLESQSQNVLPSGPLMGVYYGNPEQVKPEQMEWEMGFPVTPHALIQPPLERKEWNFTQVAVALHKGSYEKTGETIAKIMEWMEANGYVADGPIVERYLDMDPEGIKPEDLKTEIWIPVKSSQDR